MPPRLNCPFKKGKSSVKDNPIMDRFCNLVERDIDLLLLEELNCNPEFTLWFYTTQRDRISEHKLPPLDGITCIARHSVGMSNSDLGFGQTDIEVTIRGRNAGTELSVIFLVENKIDANFTEMQPERYLERSKELSGIDNICATTLVAPAGYLEGIGQFHSRISYEEIAVAIARCKPQSISSWEIRAEHKIAMLHHAIEKYRRGGNRIIDDDRTGFFYEYLDIVRALYPRLRQKTGGSKTKGSKSFFFELSPRIDHDIDHLFLQHRLLEGVALIEFRGWGKYSDYYISQLKKMMSGEEFILDADKSMIKIKLHGLPLLDLTAKASTQKDKITESALALNKLHKWYLDNYSLLKSMASQRPRSRPDA
jgi:hypothetical protein